MVFKKFKDKKLRNFFFFNEKLNLINNFIFIYLQNKIKVINTLNKRKLLTLKKNSFKNKIVNRCILTGRSSGVNKPFYIFRLPLKKFLSLGIFPGYKKAVW